MADELGFEGILDDDDVADDDELLLLLDPIDVSATTFDGPDPTFNGSHASERMKNIIWFKLI